MSYNVNYKGILGVGLNCDKMEIERGAVAKWKRWSLQNFDARVRFPPAPPSEKLTS